jgi:hypothetical protein
MVDALLCSPVPFTTAWANAAAAALQDKRVMGMVDYHTQHAHYRAGIHQPITLAHGTVLVFEQIHWDFMMLFDGVKTLPYILFQSHALHVFFFAAVTINHVTASHRHYHKSWHCLVLAFP